MNFQGTILLVDDEIHIRKYVGLILRQLGTPKLIEAANGEAAVAAFIEGNPDLVLLDVNMPIMDGIATLRRLREIDPECIVVMLTSLANRQTVDQAIALGASNYIRKDSTKDEIIAALTETITACFPSEPEPSP